jgi:hypothetical protein
MCEVTPYANSPSPEALGIRSPDLSRNLCAVRARRPKHALRIRRLPNSLPKLLARYIPLAEPVLVQSGSTVIALGLNTGMYQRIGPAVVLSTRGGRQQGLSDLSNLRTPFSQHFVGPHRADSRSLLIVKL